MDRPFANFCRNKFCGPKFLTRYVCLQPLHTCQFISHAQLLLARVDSQEFGGTIHCQGIAPRCYSGDLPQGGLEIPAC